MARQDDFDRQIRDAERERDREARQEKWAKREKKFFRTFLFTEEGKPKSSFGIYTFCLSFVFLAADAVIYGLVIDGLTPHMGSWPPVAANLVQALAATICGWRYTPSRWSSPWHSCSGAPAPWARSWCFSAGSRPSRWRQVWR